MRLPLLQRLMCLVLALLMLEAISHHGLCAAGVMECTPCQTTDQGDEDHCPNCSVSQLLVTTGIAKANLAPPAAQSVFPSFDLAKLWLIAPGSTEPPAITVHDPAAPRHGYLRDLRRSIPIRAPSRIN